MVKRLLSLFLTLVLVTAFAFQDSLKIFADGLPEYLSDVQMVTASTKEEAFSLLASEGYTVFDYNLREGLSGSVCYIGYKTTTDEKKAITDIRLMNAKGGINEINYRELVTQWKSGVETTAGYFKDACLEVAEKYKAGSPLAAAAVEILDIFEVDGEKLSSYLFSSERTDTDYQDLILICADNVVSTIYAAINLGTADYNTDSFAKKLGTLDFSYFDYSKIQLAGDTNTTYAECWERAARVLDNLQNFAMDYDDAIDFFSTYEETEGDGDGDGEVEVEETTDEEAQEYWRNFVDEKYKNSEDVEEQNLYKYASIIGLYEKLAEYPVNNAKYNNLAEYIYDCGNPFDDEGNEDLDKIIARIFPFVSCLSEGQVFTLQYGGISSLVSALDANTESNKNNTTAAIDELKKKIDENGLERISVFYNVDRDIYNKSVAFTDEANRQGTTSDSFDQLTQAKEDDDVTKTLTNIVLIGAMVAAAMLTVAVLTIGFVAAFTGATMAFIVDSVGFAVLLSGSISLVSGGLTMTTSAIVAGVVGTAFVIAALIVLAVVLICFLVMLFKKLFSDDDEEEQEELPDIPSLIFDVVDTEFTKYEAVCDKNGTPVDITCGNGSEWDVMYVSYAEEAGEPILATGDVFIAKSDSATSPDDYTPVSRFGYIDTANLHSFETNSKKPLYLFYQGKSRDGDSEQKYVADIMVSAQSTAEAARLEIIKKGFIPVEQNLTPGTGTISYLGYKTTSKSSDAITDIRIAYYYSADKFCYGTKSNGEAVQYTFVAELVTKASIYYATQKSNGSAIVADFKFSNTLLSADSGYEPVILFSGGEGYNFYNGCNESDGLRVVEEDNWNKTLYMYFKPSVTFDTSGTKYISGFAFCSSCKNDINFATQNGFKLVETLGYYDIASGVNDGKTYIMYSTTYNPYRAITEIGTFNASNSAESLFENICVGTVGYAACETFATVCDEGFFTDDYVRLLRPSNSYLTRLSYEGASSGQELVNESYIAVNNFGKYENIPMKDLYVAGPNSNKQPISVDDINFCTDAETAGRTAFVNANGETVWCKPVHDLTDYYATTADNLTFEWDYYVYQSVGIGGGGFVQYYVEDVDFTNYLRIFYRGSVEKRGTYVSNIIVVTSDPDDDNTKKYSYDQAMVNLLANGAGEIIKVNLSRSSSAQPTKHESVNEDGAIKDFVICNSYEGASTYIMVQYSNSKMDSIRTATTKWYSSSTDKASTKLKYQGVKFDGTGDIVKGISGYYSIYISKNGTLGSLVTDIVIDTDYLAASCSTVIDSEGTMRTSEDYIIKLKHASDTSNEAYIKNLTVSSTGSRNDCLEALYKAGCTNFIDANKNENLGGKYVYFGYTTTINESDPDIVRGIKLVAKSSSSHDSSFTDENGLYYECISENLNANVGGDYTYLYITKTNTASPITRLTTTGIMASSLSKYTDYKTHDWITTDNLASGTDATFKLCYRQESNDWSIDEDGRLTINISGDMKNYCEGMWIFYTKPGAVGAMKKKVNYYPEWCDYADVITDVVINSSCTSIDDCAFKNCTNITDIYIMNKTCEIDEGALPETATIRCFYDSTAANYAYEHNLNIVEFGFVMGTVVGSSNVFVIVTMSSLFVAAGVTALVIKRKKSRGKANEK